MFKPAQQGTEPTAVRHGSDRRADNHQRSISVSRDCIRIDRTLRGIAMRVAVPVRAYRGVALSLRPDAEGTLNYQLNLVHEDGDLSVILDEAADDRDIVADWRLWSRFFRLPALVERQAGVIERADATLGALMIGGEAQLRRPSRARFKRRPMFLQRRKAGHVVAEPVVHTAEHEMFARD